MCSGWSVVCGPRLYFCVEGIGTFTQLLPRIILPQTRRTRTKEKVLLFQWATTVIVQVCSTQGFVAAWRLVDCRRSARAR